MTITPGPGGDGFADRLHTMYAANEGRDLSGEHGIHRLVYRGEDGLRRTVFCCVDTGGDPAALVPGALPRRSYVTAPYRMVYDHASGRQSDDVDAVLGGDLDLVAI